MSLGLLLAGLEARNPLRAGIGCGSADGCTSFPQYQGAPEGYKDLPYDVLLPVTVPAASFLPSQSTDIDNSDAPWYLLGYSWFSDSSPGFSSGILLTVYDWNNKQMQANNPAMGNPLRPGMFQELVMGVPTPLVVTPCFPEKVWPRNSQFRADFQNVNPITAVPGMIYAWGFKRYDKKDAPCY